MADAPPTTQAGGGAQPSRLPRLLRWQTALVGAVGLALAAFVLAPAELSVKLYLALHGLCAQNPARTFALGGQPLPVDARMTGLYLGALLAAGPLLLARRRGTGVGPTWLAILIASVAVMALDGVNSLRVDLWLPAWWPPDNRLRLVTGLGAGAGLGVATVWLINLGLWPAGRPLLRPGDAAVWLAGASLVATLVLSGIGWAYAPLALLIGLAALLILGGLTLAVISLARAPETTGAPPHSPAALRRLVVLASAAAVVEMAVLAASRLALEATLGRLPPM